MAQPGIHAVLALATRNTFSTKRWFGLGLVFGSMIPDIDAYPMTYGFLFQGMNAHDAEILYHRTFSHSIFIIAGIAALFYLISLVRGGEQLRTFGAGLALGMFLIHSVVDILVWFDGIVLFWPVAWEIDLWNWVIVPPVITRLLRAVNFWGVAWFLAYLASLARKNGTNTEYLPRLQRYIQIQVGIAVIFTVLALVLDNPTYNIPDGAVFLFWAYPNAFWMTWQMRETINVGQDVLLEASPAL